VEHGLRHRAQSAHAVIDDGDGLVEGWGHNAKLGWGIGHPQKWLMSLLYLQSGG
jgi:hypothetical protein